MASRNQAEKKQFKQRKDGLMKKANDLRKLCGVKVAVIIEDEGDWFTYRSKEGWPIGFEIEGAHTLLPEDFTTLREASLERPLAVGQLSSSNGSSSSSSPALTAQSADDSQIVEATPLEAQVCHIIASRNIDETADPKETNEMCQRHVQPEAWSNPAGNGPVWNHGGDNQSAMPYNNRALMVNNSNQHIQSINSQPNTFPTMGSINAGQEGRGWIMNNGSRVGMVGNYARYLSKQQPQMYINP